MDNSRLDGDLALAGVVEPSDAQFGVNHSNTSNGDPANGSDLEEGEDDDGSEDDESEDEDEDDDEDDEDEDEEDELTELMVAAENGDIEEVQRLLDAGASVHERGPFQRTPLFFAAENGHDAVVKLLIERGAEVDATDSEDEKTPLFLAAENDHLTTLLMLIEHGASVSERGGYGSVLAYAARTGHVRIIQALIDNGVSVDDSDWYGQKPLYFASTPEAVDVLVKNGASVNETGGFDETPMFNAAKEGYVDVVKALIRHGASVNAVNGASATPLFNATESGQVGVMKILLENGADLDHKDRENMTALTKAAIAGRLDPVLLLIESGASVAVVASPFKEKNETTPLMAAVNAGHLDVIKALIEHGAPIDVKNSSGETLIVIAVKAGHTDVMQALIDNGVSVKELSGDKARTPLFFAAEADSLGAVSILLECGVAVDEKDSDGKTALFEAARGGNIDVARFLIERGASVHHESEQGRTPLFEAAENGHTEMMLALVSAGSDVNHRSRDGSTALFATAFAGHEGVVSTLIKQGAVVDAQDSTERTPLFEAARGGHKGVVSTLIKQGAVVDAKDICGRTPLFDAARGGHVDVAEFLIQNGADIHIADESGGTPLGDAVTFGRTEAALMLIKAGASVNVMTRANDSPSSIREPLVIVAGRGGYIEILKALVHAGALVNVRGHDGETPLISVARWEYPGGTSLLLSHGAAIRSDAVEDGEVPLISGSLDTVSERWEESFEFRDVVKRVVERLEGVHSVLQRDASSEFLASCLPTLANILFRVVRLLFQIEKRENVLLRFVASRAFLGKIRAVLEEVDHFADLLGIELEIGAADWKTNWDSDVAVVMSRFREALEAADDASFQGGYASFQEPAVLLQYELQHQDALSTAESRELLETTKSRLLRLCGHESISVPDWFISRDDIDYHAWNTLESSTKLEDDLKKYIGKWVRTKVTIAEVTYLEESWSVRMRAYRREDESDGANDTGDDGRASESEDEDENGGEDEDEEDVEDEDEDEDEDEEDDEEDKYKDAKLENVIVKWFKLSHPNVVELYGANNIGLPNLLVFEHSSNGYLLDYLRASEDNRRWTWPFLRDIALGLQYLHQRDVVHGDLRCSNFVVGANRVAKISGFGERFVPLKQEVIRNEYIMNWRAPEIMLWQYPVPVTVETDIYALGMCIVEAVTLELPWTKDTKSTEIISLVRDGQFPSCPANMSDAQWDLVTKMCAFEPSDRPNLVYIVTQLKQFAMAVLDTPGCEDQSGELHDPTIGEAANTSVEEFVFPELSGTIPAALHLIRQKCRELPESDWMASKVFTTLVYTYERIREQEKRPADVEVAKFCSILARVQGYLRRAVSEKSIARFARSRKVAETHHVVYAELDRMLDMLNVTANDPIRSWKRSADEHDDEANTRSDASSGSVTSSGGSPSGEKQEAVTVVHYNSSGEVCSQDEAERNGELSHAPWLLPLSELIFTEADRIGQGAFGAVYKGVWLDTQVVVKFMGYEEDADTIPNSLFLHEVRVWRRLTHPHVVKLYGACHVDKRYFVCEFAPNGELSAFLKRDGNARLVWQKLHEAALGLEYLHGQNVVHNDLKCDNILIGMDGKAKLIDFGLSALVNVEEVMVDVKRMGAVHWKSPEYLTGGRPSFASDVYSFAMCVLEVLTGDIPWGKNANPTFVKFQVKKGRTPTFPESLSAKQKNLLELMTKTDPSARVKMSFVVDKLYEISKDEVRSLDDA